MTPYITAADFDQAFTEQERIDLTLDDPANFARAAGDASSLADGYIGTRYTLPLASTPAIIVGWVLDIARYRLWDNRAPDEVRNRYQDALAGLKQLAQGLIALPPDAQGAPAPTDYPMAGYSSKRVFNDCTLGDFANDVPRAVSDPFRWPPV